MNNHEVGRGLLALVATAWVVAGCTQTPTAETTDAAANPATTAKPGDQTTSNAKPYPIKEGECLPGVVAEKKNRFDYYSEEDPGFNREVAVTLTYEIPSGDPDYPNGGIGIYAGDESGRFEGAKGQEFMASNDFLPGAAVEVCLVVIPDYCPGGDPRGRIFALKDTKTGRAIQGRQGWNDCGDA